MNPVSESLPGADLVSEGLADLTQGRDTELSLLVLIASPRLRGLGLDVPTRTSDTPFEHQLYDRLESRLGAGAHSYYNSLIRRIVSFARAADHRLSRLQRS